jgi:hypothetical protein
MCQKEVDLFPGYALAENTRHVCDTRGDGAMIRVLPRVNPNWQSPAPSLSINPISPDGAPASARHGRDNSIPAYRLSGDHVTAPGRRTRNKSSGRIPDCAPSGAHANVNAKSQNVIILSSDLIARWLPAQGSIVAAIPSSCVSTTPIRLTPIE